MATARDIKAGGAYIELYVKGEKLIKSQLAVAQRQFQMFAKQMKLVSISVNASLASMNKAFLAFGRGAGSLVRSVRNAMSAIGSRMALGGLIGGGAIAWSVGVFAGFEYTMSKVQAVTGAVGQQFDAINAKAKELGKTTLFTTRQVGEGMFYLAMAGFKPDEILDGIENMLNIALAGDMDVGRVSDIVTNISTPFGIAAKDISRVVDVLAKAATSSNTNIEEMGYAFQYAAAPMELAGQTLEETAAALMLLANNGQKASRAGTQLQTIAAQLAKDDIIEKLRGMGVSVFDKQGNMRKLMDVLVDLDKATSHLGARKLSVFENLFGKRAMTAAAIIGKNKDAVKEFRNESDNATGSSKEMARVMGDNLRGDLVALWSAIEGVQIEIGQALMPALRELAQWLTTKVRGISDWVKVNQELVVSVAKVTAGVLAGGVALMAIGGAISFVGTAIAPIAIIAGTVFSAIAAGAMLAISTVGLLGGAIMGAFSLAVSMIGIAVSSITAIVTTISGLAVFFGATGGVGIAAGIIAVVAALGGIVLIAPKIITAFGSIVSGSKKSASILVNAFSEARDSLKDVFENVLEDAKNVFASIKETFKGLSDALYVGDLSLAIKILWADIKLRFEQGKEFIRDFATEALAIFRRLWRKVQLSFDLMIDSIKSALGSLVNSLKKTFLEGVRSVLEVSKHSFGLVPKLADMVGLTDEAIGFVNIAIKGVELDEKFAQKEVGRKGIIAQYQKDREKIKGADWNNTTKEIENAQKELDALKENAAKKVANKGKFDFNDNMKGQMAAGAAWQNLQETVANKASFAEVLGPARMKLLFAGSQGTFSGYDAAGGSINSISSDKIISILEKIEENTEDYGGEFWE